MASSQDRAFLLVALDIQETPPRVLGVDVFSEERPTQTTQKIRWSTLASAPGRDFNEALVYMRRLLESPWYAWVLPLLSDRARSSLQEAAEPAEPTERVRA